MAKILTIYLKIKYKDIQTYIIEIESNPADYDQMLNFYEDKLSEIKPDENSQNVLVLSPGTPPQTMGLIINFLPFLDNTRALYVSRNGIVKPVKLLRTLIQKQWLNTIKELVERYDYQSVAKVLDNSNIPDKSLTSFLLSCHHRLNFHFDFAQNLWKKYSSMIDWSDSLEEFGQQLTCLLKKDDQWSFIQELFYNVEVKQAKEQFSEMIALVFRFQEAIIVGMVEDKLGIKIIKANGKFESFNRSIESMPELKNYLDAKNLKYRDNPNRLVLSKILSYFLKKEGDHDWKSKLEKFMDFSKKIGRLEAGFWEENGSAKSLADLRNSSQYGHGFKGISIEQIKEIYKGDLIEDMRSFLALLAEKKISDNPFKLANRIILEKLKFLSF
jgi:hypothetical protein